MCLALPSLHLIVSSSPGRNEEIMMKRKSERGNEGAERLEGDRDLG
jgi:hypothetical protein